MGLVIPNFMVCFWWLKLVKALVFFAWVVFQRILCFYGCPKVVEGFCQNRAPPLDPPNAIQVARLPQRKALPRGGASVPGGDPPDQLNIADLKRGEP